MGDKSIRTHVMTLTSKTKRFVEIATKVYEEINRRGATGNMMTKTEAIKLRDSLMS